MMAGRIGLFTALVICASPATVWAQPADASGDTEAPGEASPERAREAAAPGDDSRAEPSERVVSLEPPPRAALASALDPAEEDPWEGWTPRERSNFAFAWFPGLFFGLPGFIGTIIGASIVAADPASSADPSLWSALAVIPAAGPWIRLLDPGIDNYGAPVALAVANVLSLTGLIAGISMLALLIDRGSRVRRGPPPTLEATARGIRLAF